MPKLRGANGDEQQPVCSNCARAERYCDHSRQATFRHYQRHSKATIDTNDPSSALANREIADLFHHYVSHLAAWYDLSDGKASFTKIVPLIALSSSLLFNAIVAFAAIHRSRTHAPSSVAIAERFHGACVKELIHIGAGELDKGNGHILAAVCLLRSFELLAEDSDPNRHLSGAYALAASNFPIPQETSLLKAGFFNYLREDITYSLIHRCPLKIDVSGIDVPDSAQDDEDHLNIASLYLANTANEVFEFGAVGTSQYTIAEPFRRWKASLPVQFSPYYEAELNETGLTFPVIRMLRDCHVSVLQYSLVTETLGSLQDSSQQGTAETNAIRICGLAFSSGSPAVIVNSFGPMSFCCRYLQHESLRTELVRRLQSSREETGWPVKRMIDELKAHWESIAS